MLKRFHRPRPVAWFFFLFGFGLCVTLGSWQVQRLAWKETLIAQIAAANADAPLADLPQDAASLEPLQFRKVAVQGQWIEGIEFHLAPRYFRNQFGYWILAPLKLADGRVVMINRGWVPGAKKLVETRPETAVHGTANVVGLLRVGAERSYFTPKNQPEKNVWFGRDVEEMAEYAKLGPVVPAMVDVIGVQDVQQLPVPSDGVIRLRNDHLSYILTWYGIAAGILVIFVMYHRKK